MIAPHAWTVARTLLAVLALTFLWLVFDGWHANKWTVYTNADVVSVCVRDAARTPQYLNQLPECMVSLLNQAWEKQRYGRRMVHKHELRMRQRYEGAFDGFTREHTRADCTVCIPI